VGTGYLFTEYCLKSPFEGEPNPDWTTEFVRLFFRRSRLQPRANGPGGDDHKFGRELGPTYPSWPAAVQTGTPVRINQAAAVCLKVCALILFDAVGRPARRTADFICIRWVHRAAVGDGDRAAGSVQLVKLSALRVSEARNGLSVHKPLSILGFKRLKGAEI